MVNGESSAVRGGSPLDRRAVRTAMAIPAHVVQAKGHGHAGTAMALAPLAHVLFSRVLRHDPTDPTWEGRDRFVLSAGHASLLLYVQLYLTGYGLELGDLALSRTLDSRTPGHPELGHTPGVEMSTGPLGQGVASAVGIALAARRDEALHGHGSGVFASRVWVIAGDGCLQEGVSAEASSLAGTVGLGNLVLLWDDNGITIDGRTEVTFREDVRARYRAYGWRVLEVSDASDLDELERVLRDAEQGDGRPTLVAVRSVIGAPSPSRAGTPAAHAGGFGDEDVAAVKELLGFARDAGLDDLVDDEVLAHCRDAVMRGKAAHEEWDARHREWAAAHPGTAAARSAVRIPDPAVLAELVAGTPVDQEAVATRSASGSVLVRLHGAGVLWGGSADLSGSTSVAVPGEAVDPQNPGGGFVHFGIREHAMAAILSGIALHGLWRPYGSTYLAFSDYQRPALRLAALMQLPVIHVYTHDSVAVGEDGPTHQPVEQTAALRTIPGLTVIRPGDAHETVAAWHRVATRPEGPVALVLSRQTLPVLAPVDPDTVARGGYVAFTTGNGADVALLASGSELHLAIEAARRLGADGVGVRVVSLPCWEWFEQQEQSYRDTVLPPALRRRVAVEAGRGDAWYRWVGLDGRVVSIERFGESGSGAQVLERRGITTDAVERAARTLLVGA